MKSFDNLFDDINKALEPQFQCDINVTKYRHNPNEKLYAVTLTISNFVFNDKPFKLGGKGISDSFSLALWGTVSPLIKEASYLDTHDCKKSESKTLQLIIQKLETITLYDNINDVYWDPAEHSTMIYLLDAIESSPDKTLSLCKIACNKLRSEKFYEYINRLHIAFIHGLSRIPTSSILQETDAIRNELR